MTPARGGRRHRAAAVALACFLLAGCGDLDDLGERAAQGFNERAGSALREAEEALRETGWAEAAGSDPAAVEEAMSWPSRPADPPGLEASTTSAGSDGTWAAQDSTYPEEFYDEVVAHYTGLYGKPPTEQESYSRWIAPGPDGGEVSTTVTRAEDGSFTVTNVWHAP